MSLNKMNITIKIKKKSSLIKYTQIVFTPIKQKISTTNQKEKIF